LSFVLNNALLLDLKLAPWIATSLIKFCLQLLCSC
jgi:hypothetical protein